jgi:hypothetical protein
MELDRHIFRSVGARAAFKIFVVYPFRTWLVMGGATERHPNHHTVWTAVLSLFGALWGGLVFATKSPVAHDVGWASLGFAAYIGASFFLPLWLPPIRDEAKVAQRRSEYERKLRMTIEAIRMEAARSRELKDSGS